jgi:PAS domain S-box-containing protein
VESYSKPVIDSKGETSSIISSTRDVTDQVIAEQKLKDSEEQYRLLSENSNDVIAIYNVNAEVIYISPSCRQVLGYEPHELLGKKAGELVSANEDAFVAKQKIQQMLSSKSTGKFIQKITTKNGEEKMLEVWGKPIFKGSEFVAIQAASRDVTQREKLLVELEQSLAKERELNELRSMFVSTASHQFRTPLTVIQSGIELMEMYIEDLPGPKQEKFRRQFNKIESEVDRLQYLMSDILLLGRANAARTPFHPETCDIVSFCKDIIENKYNNRYSQDRKTILSVLGENVPVDFDPKLLGHAIENVISNAYKYSEQGNLFVELRFTTDEVKIDITDQGIGIPEEDLKNLFQPFYRAANTCEIEGTGLGLAIVREFIEKHGGKIIVTSKLNKGTTVSVILPIKQNLS